MNNVVHLKKLKGNNKMQAPKKKDILGQLGELMILAGTAKCSPDLEKKIDLVVVEAAKEIRRLRELLRNKPSVHKEERFL